MENPVTKEDLEGLRSQITTAFDDMSIAEPPHVLCIIRKTHEEETLSLAVGCTAFLADCASSILNTLVDRHGPEILVQIISNISRVHSATVQPVKNSVFTGKGGTA